MVRGLWVPVVPKMGDLMGTHPLGLQQRQKWVTLLVVRDRRAGGAWNNKNKNNNKNNNVNKARLQRFNSPFVPFILTLWSNLLVVEYYFIWMLKLLMCSKSEI